MRFIKLWPWVVFGVLLVLVGVWQFSPLHDHFSLSALEAWGRDAQSSRETAMWVVLGYLAGGLLAFPHGLMIWATAFIFPPLTAIAYAEAGTLLSGLAVYFVGRTMSHALAERLAGSRLNSLREGFAKNAAISIVLLHIFPIMPFTILNLAAGSSKVRVRDFVIGTMLGVTPGIVLVCLFGHQLLRILHHPNVFDGAVLLAFVIMGFFLLRALRKALNARTQIVRL